MSQCPHRHVTSTDAGLVNQTFLLKKSHKHLFQVDYFSCSTGLFFKIQSSDDINALITVWVSAAILSPKSLLHSTSRGQCGMEEEVKTKLENGGDLSFL